MIPARNSYVNVFFVVVYMTSRRVSTALPITDDLKSDLKFLERYRNVNTNLDSLKNTISSLDTDLAENQKRTCQFGLNSHHCALSALDNAMSASNWLNSGHSPGKRSQAVADPETVDKYHRMLEDILTKRDHLAFLNSLLDDASKHLETKSKRTCMFNLGGTCATELASAIADQYYYLNGPRSPGRRRRRGARNNIQLRDLDTNV